MPTGQDTPIPLPPADSQTLAHPAHQTIPRLIDLANSGYTNWLQRDGTQTSLTLTADQQQTLQTWLEELPTPRLRTLKAIASAVGRMTGHGDVAARIKGGELTLLVDWQIAAPTVDALLGYLMATVLTRRVGVDFVRRCPECGVFFFDIPHGRPVKQFCRPEHANAHRQRQYRKRKSR